MVAIIDEQPTQNKTSSAENTSLHYDVNTIDKPSSTAVMTNADANHQLLLSSKFILHAPKAGLNALVDAAGYLFSIMGRLKQVKSYRQLSNLRTELIQEINIFQDAVKSHGYSSEYIVFSRYAVCAALDDIISNTSWGTKGQWGAHSLLNTFNHSAAGQEPINQERFFVILERLIKDPNVYIDIMEFMYICLSLGFKGNYRSTEYNKTQLEQITNSLYKHIRAYRGDFSKTLSPFPIKSSAPPATTTQPAAITKKATNRKTRIIVAIILTATIVFAIFSSAEWMAENKTNTAIQDLTRMG
jgi:type VI secretion system protein ImpK